MREAALPEKEDACGFVTRQGLWKISAYIEATQQRELPEGLL